MDELKHKYEENIYHGFTFLNRHSSAESSFRKKGSWQTSDPCPINKRALCPKARSQIEKEDGRGFD
jgi:hypothetical protein